MKLTNESISYQKYIERIMYKHLLIEKGIVNEQKDNLTAKNLNETFVHYILSTNSGSYDENINKYSVGNYYMELSKQYNKIAIKKNISRNDLWKMIRKNIILKNTSKTEHRLYKYIFRGEIIPSPRYVYKTLQKNDDLTTYLSIFYLDEAITPELNMAYKKLKKY